MGIDRDLRSAVRSLHRDWLVNLVAILSLAIAIAGNTTVFSFVNGVIFRPLPYPEPERVVLVGERRVNAPQTLTVSPANFRDLDGRSAALGGLAGFVPGSAAAGREERPVSIAAARVSPSFFELLGAPLLAGRAFTAAEGEVGSDDVVVVTDEFLATHQPALERPVGASLFVDGRERTIVGVLDGDFDFFFPNLQVWLPLTFDPAAPLRDERTIFVVGRLQPGATMEQAREQLQSVWDELVRDHPDSNAGYLIEVINFQDEIPNDQGRVLFGLLQGVVFFVLLIACVNIANLMSARGQRRKREIAIRGALGAGRTTILRQLAVESLALAAVAGALGLAGAWLGVEVVADRFAAAVAAPYLPEIDLRVVAFSTGLTVVAALLFGLLPGLGASRVDLAAAIKDGGPGTGGSTRRKRLSRGLVVAEIALSMVLLAGAGILVQGFQSVRDAPAGFDDDNLLTAGITLPVESGPERMDLLSDIGNEARALPGVADATFASALPLNAFAATSNFAVVGRPVASAEARPSAYWSAVDASYLRAMRIPLVRGRFFDAGDRHDATPVVVVNETLARLHFPDGALGERILFRGRAREIVGVVGDTRQSLIGSDVTSLGQDSALFVPLAQQTPGSPFLMLRTATDPRLQSAPLRARIEALHPRLVLAPPQTLQEVVDQVWVGIDLINDVLEAFGLLALLLSAIGTYGVLAFNVAQRAHEIGIRVALGARSQQVVRMIVRQGLWLGVVGVALGAPVVFGLVRVLRYALLGLGSIHIGSAFAVAAVLLGTTAAASFLPALRAARLDPMQTLRDG